MKFLRNHIFAVTNFSFSLLKKDLEELCKCPIPFTNPKYNKTEIFDF